MNPLNVLSNHVIAEVMQNPHTGQKSLHALQSFQPGDVINPFRAKETLSSPSYLTVQTDVDKHIMLDPVFLQYINHSCEPNVFFDTSSMFVIALKELRPGDELTFFYPSTEWHMVQPFRCNCGTASCLGEIRGAAHIPADLLKNYRLTDFIQQQLHERTRKARA
jgi:hypothetical protein